MISYQTWFTVIGFQRASLTDVTLRLFLSLTTSKQRIVNKKKWNQIGGWSVYEQLKDKLYKRKRYLLKSNKHYYLMKNFGMAWITGWRNSDLILVEKGVTDSFKQVRHDSRTVYLSRTKTLQVCRKQEIHGRNESMEIMATIEKRR